MSVIRKLLSTTGMAALADLYWWRKRAKRHGARSVLDLRHAEAEVAAVTQRQKQTLFPLLRDRLNASERVILDFGCGPGRFTPALADLIDGRAIGVDAIAHLLDLAPHHERVEYRLARRGRIPLPDASVDAVWICLVLMVIADGKPLRRAVTEIGRVLRPGGLIFLVENTEDLGERPHLRYRSVEDYQTLFPYSRLEHIGDYEDFGERISIMAGRKTNNP